MGEVEKKSELNVLLMAREVLLCMCYSIANGTVPVKQMQNPEQCIHYAGFSQRDGRMVRLYEHVM